MKKRKELRARLLSEVGRLVRFSRPFGANQNLAIGRLIEVRKKTVKVRPLSGRRKSDEWIPIGSVRPYRTGNFRWEQITKGRINE